MTHKQSPSKAWRAQKFKYQLVGCRCTHCTTLFYPAVTLCTICRKTTYLEAYSFSGKGSLISYSLVRVAPEGFDRFVPYPVAIVKLVEGPHISTQLVDWDQEDLVTGSKVEAVFRKLYTDNTYGVLHYGIKFRPLRR